MTMYAVLINEGPLSAEDNAVYFCQNAPTIVARVVSVMKEVDGQDTLFSHEVVKAIRFLPTNRIRRGQWHEVPYERLVSIVERD